MECPNCNSANPETNKFCANCGALLKTSPIYNESELNAKINSIIETRLKDQTLIEFETTENIVSKISAWAKLFGFFIGIPLAIFAIILGLLGYNSFSKFTSFVEKNGKEINNKILATKDTINNLNSKTAKMNTAADSLKIKLLKSELLLAHTEGFSNKLNLFEKQFAIRSEALNKQILLYEQLNGITSILYSDTFSGNVLHGSGRLFGKIPNNYFIYGLLIIGNQYSVMNGSFTFDENGNWNHDFVIGIDGGRIQIGLLLCDKNASEGLERQFEQHNWVLRDLKPGMRILGIHSVSRKSD